MQPMTGILRKWAALGRQLALAQPVVRPTWAPARRMATAAGAWFEAQADRVTTLLGTSNKLLEPLGDPLLTDFGGHRWLAGDREEAYSDWLQWILRQIQTPRALFRVIQVDEPSDLQNWPCGPPDVGREQTVPKGHEGRKGRLDLVVRSDGRALFVLELKTTDADAADTGKHSGYQEWLEAQPERHKDAILIATDAEADDYGGFRFLSWADLCLALRRLARRDCAEGRLIVAAMTLAFVGAVEQNLLAFHAPGTGGRGVLNPRLPSHLTQWIEQPEL